MDSVEEVIKLSEGIQADTIPQTGVKDPDDVHSYTKEEQIIKSMVKNVSLANEQWNVIYDSARQDINFAYYDQWEPAARKEREDANRPVVSPTLIPQYIHRITGAARQSKFSVHVQQTGGPSMAGITQAGAKIAYAEVMEGLIRDIEAKSSAPLAYCRALQHAVEGAIGWLRVKTVMGPHDPFNSEIVIEHVRDRFSVIMDHLAEKPDFSDANFGFIGKYMSMDDYKARWPDEARRNMANAHADSVIRTHRSFWTQGDTAMVGEYYWKEPVTKTALRLMHQETHEEFILYKEDNIEILDELASLGYGLIESKKHKTWQVKVCLASANSILEGPWNWPGTVIPIVPVVGRQIDLDGRVDYHAVHHYAMDSQIMFNYMSSAAIERVAKAPNSPWIMTAGQIAGLEDMWNDQHVNSRDVLYYNYMEDEPPPKREAGAEIPAAEITLVNLFRQNLMEAIGIYEAGLGQTSNETSGLAIQQRQMAGEYGSLEFLDNLTHSVGKIGDIICEIIPKVYSQNKMQRLIMDDGAEVKIVLNHKIKNEEDGTEHTINNLSLSRFSTHSIAGPSFTSQRSEFLNSLIEIAKTSPSVFGVALDLIVKYMDFPGGRALEKRLKALVPRHLLSPEEQEDLPPQEPTPEQMVEMKKSEAMGIKAQADVEIASLRVDEQELEVEAARMKVRESEVKALEGEREASMAENEGDGIEEDELMKKLEVKMEAVFKKLIASHTADEHAKQAAARKPKK